MTPGNPRMNGSRDDFLIELLMGMPTLGGPFEVFVRVTSGRVHLSEKKGDFKFYPNAVIF